MVRQYLKSHKWLWLAPMLVVLYLTAILLFMDALRIGDGTIPSDAPVKEWAR